MKKEVNIHRMGNEISNLIWVVAELKSDCNTELLNKGRELIEADEEEISNNEELQDIALEFVRLHNYLEYEYGLKEIFKMLKITSSYSLLQLLCE